MKVYVAGVYQTKFGELWNRGVGDLVREAAEGALKDAGLEASRVEAVYVGSKLGAWVAGQNHIGALVAEELGVNCPVVAIEAACASGGVAVAEAAGAVEAGKYERVLVVGVEKMSDVGVEVVSEALMGAAAFEEREAGLTFPGLYALMARGYMERFGLSRKQLALVSVKNHKHGALNPKAHFGFLVTAEKVMESVMVASPLRLLDCSGVSDGAAAVVLEKPRAGLKKKNKVMLVGSGQASDSLSLAARESLVELKATKMAAKIALEAAGVEIGEVGVLEVHDCFSIAEILAYEDLGMAEKGRGIELVEKGWVELGGGQPVNTSGGLKACGHPVGATGVKQVVEVVRQLRGELGERQVEGVRVGLAHNVGGTGGTVVVNVLQR